MQYRFIRFPEGKTKAFTTSYDDGCRDDIRLATLLKDHGIKGTFNITTPEKEGAWRLSYDEISKYILDAGHEVAVHGALHKAPGIARPIEGITDILDCRKNLEKAFGRIIRGLAFPDSGIVRMMNGNNYENIKGYLEDLDIAYARTLAGDNNSFLLPTDWHSWMPTAKHTNEKIFDWLDEFVTLDYSNLYSAARYSRLFYLWGHSFEFERAKNWDVIEKICEKVSGKEDIWYATNIEICEYVKAYQSLVYSADATRVYNPTLYTIWFEYDEKLYSINPGETLCI